MVDPLRARIQARRLRRWWIESRSDLGRAKRDGVAQVGEGTYGAPSVQRFGNDDVKLIIGKYCSISERATFLLGGNHVVSSPAAYPLRRMMNLPGAGTDNQPYSRGNIVVGNDVWIGAESMVLSGVTLGDGCVVAARAVVTRDVAPYTIVAGVPARVISSRCSPEEANKMAQIAWWDWSPALIAERVADLADQSITNFVRSYPTS